MMTDEELLTAREELKHHSPHKLLHIFLTKALDEIDRLKKDVANYYGKCAVCCTRCCDMLTDNTCIACENERLKIVEAEYQHLLEASTEKDE